MLVPYFPSLFPVPLPKIRRSAPPIAEGLGGGEAAGDRREQSVDLGLLLDVVLED